MAHNLLGMVRGLIESHADELKSGPPRIVLLTNGPEHGSITEVHEQLAKLGIPHKYAEDKKREHSWTSGWLPVAAELLFK